MATSFQKINNSDVDGLDTYVWSDPDNWTSGVPVNGEDVTITPAGTNGSVVAPDSYDDIAGAGNALTLNHLTLGNDVVLAIGGTLTVGQLVTPGSVDFFSDSAAGVYAATLTINGFSGETVVFPSFRIGAFGPRATTILNATPFLGALGTVEYDVADGGTLLVNASQQSTTVFDYDAAPGLASFPYDSGTGTFAFTAIATKGQLGSLYNVGTGDSLELPGSTVTAVSFGATSITVTTNLRTTVFTVGSYAPGRTPTGFVASADLTTGLESVLFITGASTTFTPPATPATLSWSDGGNWSDGVPQSGAAVTLAETQATGTVAQPNGVDDIAGLRLSSLTLAISSTVDIVVQDLTVDSLVAGAGSHFLVADTEAANAAAHVTLTVDSVPASIPGSSISLGAVGAGAVVRVDGNLVDGNLSVTTNPLYVIGDGGEVIFDVPQDAYGKVDLGGRAGVAAGSTGTVAFVNTPVHAPTLQAFAPGDTLELPGTAIHSVIFGSTDVITGDVSVSVTTDQGTTSFQTAPLANDAPTGYTTSVDPVTHLLAVHFIAAQQTTFTQAPSASGFNPNNVWSNAAAWSNGIPQAGAIVTLNLLGALGLMMPGSYDDLPSLSLTSLTINGGTAAIGGALTVGNLITSGGSQVFADSLMAGGAAQLTIGAFDASDTAEFDVGAVGSGAVTRIETDAGTLNNSITYRVSAGGKLIFDVPQTPLVALPNVDFTTSIPGNSGTVAFEGPLAPGRNATLLDLAFGDTVEVPGQLTQPVTIVSDILTITTDAGAYTFGLVGNQVTSVNDDSPTLDMTTGLEAITFNSPACYLRGTMLLTPSGETPVEALQAGQHILTASGIARPVRWIGRRSYLARFAAHSPELLPICFEAGSLGPGVPARDLFVSSKHAMFLDGVLVPANALVNGITIRRSAPGGDVHYYHVELDSHDILVAEGAASESFVDDDSRGVFHNAAEGMARHPRRRGVQPEFFAPRIENGWELETIRGRLPRPVRRSVGSAAA